MLSVGHGCVVEWEVELKGYCASTTMYRLHHRICQPVKHPVMTALWAGPACLLNQGLYGRLLKAEKVYSSRALANPTPRSPCVRSREPFVTVASPSAPFVCFRVDEKKAVRMSIVVLEGMASKSDEVTLGADRGCMMVKSKGLKDRRGLMTRSRLHCQR